MTSAKARYVMVGGFLGAGKTTALGALARHLDARGLRVGLITNDQSTGLVDTALLQSQGFPVAEIGGGCFSCRFNSLSEAVARARRYLAAIPAPQIGQGSDAATLYAACRLVRGFKLTEADTTTLLWVR